MNNRPVIYLQANIYARSRSRARNCSASCCRRLPISTNNRPNRLYTVTSDTEDTVVEVHIRITVGNKKFKLIAKLDFTARLIQCQYPVLITTEVILHSADILRLRSELPVSGKGLEPGIDSCQVRMTLAHDGR